MKRFFAWGNRNAASIYTGCVVAMLMMIIIFVKDIKNTSREIEHLGQMRELMTAHEQLAEEYHAAGEFIEFQSLIMDNLRDKSGLQEQHLMQLSDMLNEQTLILKTLIDYLKKIGEWPPKIDPPKPVDPDTLAKERSEAI